MKVFVKICGLACAEDVEAVAALRPDAMGFVFWPRSPRAARAEDVAVWTRGLDPAIRKVGVFVDDEPEEVQRVKKVAGLDVVQWHGHPGASLPERLPTPVWRVVHLDGEEPAPERVPVDAWLIDRYTASSPGGTGLTADWDQAAAFVRRTTQPVLLAGGLRPVNVGEALARVRPWGVDTSSGVEREPGRKDIEQVKEFIERCRKG